MSQPRVVLVGPPGAGKTTIGRRLARALNTTHVDSDEEGVRRTNQTPTRPVVTGAPGIDPAVRYQQLVDERAPLYREVSGFKARTDHRTPQKVVADILRYLETIS